MREISDLTRDTRPTLEDILTDTIHDVIDIDMSRSSDNGQLVEYENRTFYYRVIFLFMQRVALYYSDTEVEDWCRRELLKETILPDIDSYGKSSQL